MAQPFLWNFHKLLLSILKTTFHMPGTPGLGETKTQQLAILQVAVDRWPPALFEILVNITRVCIRVFTHSVSKSIKLWSTGMSPEAAPATNKSYWSQ